MKTEILNSFKNESRRGLITVGKDPLFGEDFWTIVYFDEKGWSHSKVFWNKSEAMSEFDRIKEEVAA